jgi:hypothetical protein
MSDSVCAPASATGSRRQRRLRLVTSSLCAAALGVGALVSGALPASASNSLGQVDLLRPESGTVIRSYNASFNSGDSLAMGDITNDGADEVVVANTNGRISVQDAFGFTISSFPSAYDGSGDTMAVGDMTGDGAAEIVVANDEGGRIDVFDLFGHVISSFDSAYDSNDQIALGEVTGDKFDELVVANTEGGGRMDVLDLFGKAITSFGNTGFDASDEVAMGNLIGVDRDEIVVANDEQSGRVNVFGGLGGVQRTWASGLHSPELVVGNAGFGSLDEIGLIEKRVPGAAAPNQSMRFYTSTGLQFRTVTTTFTPKSDLRQVRDSVAVGNLADGALDEIVVANT